MPLEITPFDVASITLAAKHFHNRLAETIPGEPTWDRMPLHCQQDAIVRFTAYCEALAIGFRGRR